MFEVNSIHGGALFTNENDAINALFLLSLYHDIELNEEKVRRELDRNFFYEVSSLSITRTA
ncbi:MAG: hypothetical protein HFG51_16250 [Lachnospiraceae bacterium]|nr:hypothetical protein [Lachnospiraceae bacterium]